MSIKHIRFKELCLENGNPEAHYIVQYFVHKEKQTGLFHLRQSATGNNGNGNDQLPIIAVLLMLAEGHYQTGKKYLDKFQWKKKRSTSDHCCERIKNSLSAIPVPMEQRYYVNMVNLRPHTNCDPNNMAKVCKQCY